MLLYISPHHDTSTALEPVVWGPIGGNPGLNFNLGLFFFSSEAFSWTIFSRLFFLERPIIKLYTKRILKLNLHLKLSYLNSNFALTLVILTQLWTSWPCKVKLRPTTLVYFHHNVNQLLSALKRPYITLLPIYILTLSLLIQQLCSQSVN